MPTEPDVAPGPNENPVQHYVRVTGMMIEARRAGRKIEESRLFRLLDELFEQLTDAEDAEARFILRTLHGFVPPAGAAVFIRRTVGAELQRALRHAGCGDPLEWPPDEDLAWWRIVHLFWWNDQGNFVLGEAYKLGALAKQDGPDVYVPDGHLPPEWGPGWTLTIHAWDAPPAPTPHDTQLVRYLQLPYVTQSVWSIHWPLDS